MNKPKDYLHSLREEFIAFIHELQNSICEGLELIDGEARFEEDSWERPGGGGGKTRVISEGAVFEKGGVNTSVVHGDLPANMAKHLGVPPSRFFACGISLVIHPRNPMLPTVHANYRYFELYNEVGELVDQWFGGGADLTPYYLWEEDAVHFHRCHKTACDGFDPEYYPRFKKQCDEYFVNHHRDGEARGIGGIFFDYQRPDAQRSAQQIFEFSKACGAAFLPSYVPIVQRRMLESYNEQQLHWQGIRRGRYVEFNLIHDRGTLFGLRTKGRIESILMSLPAQARWAYDFHPAPGSPEAKLLEHLRPRDWAAGVE